MTTDISVSEYLATHPCDVCGAPSTNLYQDPIEMSPYVDEKGTAWRRWKAGTIYGRCDQHRPKGDS